MVDTFKVVVRSHVYYEFNFIFMEKMYSLNEVCILPSDHPTKLTSRSEVNPFVENNKLPIFVSPMTCVINETNFDTFRNSKVIPILPRGISQECITNDDWVAYSLSDFKKSLDHDLSNKKILIDLANGHMESIYDLVVEAKSKWNNLTIMIGNIAHPGLYKKCCDAGVDYVRVGIGGGNGCSTSVQTGVHTSIQWILSGIREIKQDLFEQSINTDTPIKFTKVIADGGIDCIGKAIKCLALGADYVMMGKQFAQCEEGCSKVITINGVRHHEYYGMASSKGQIDISGGYTKNPEGIVTSVPITTNLQQYCFEFESALRSAMTYTDSYNLSEFKHVKTGIQSFDEFNAYNK